MIKNFIYLDEQKLYSFSSQLFEGVTAYFLNQKGLEHTEQENQKGSIASGRAIADAVKEASTSTTKKFLHDYAFNLFEAELINSDRLINVSSDGYTYSDICKSDKPFIRIRAKGKFVDIKEVGELFAKFNDIGDAIARSQLFDEYQQLEQLKSGNKNGPQTREMQSNIDKNVREIKAKSDLALPKEVLNSIGTILEQFGDDMVRFNQEINDSKFSTCMTPEFFRDSIKSICRKYSRKTAKEFVVLGTISHSHDTPNVELTKIPDEATMISHMVGLSENLYELEQIFGSRGENEIIIEPIAVYTEL